jgi:phosphatidylserine/phosphatidylglycerophosphate/cardiolipin synthase-like enzyme
MLLQTNSGKRKHVHLLSELIRRSEVSILCSGWVKLPGLEELLPSIDAALAKGAAITVYSNPKETLEGVAPALASRAGLTHRVVSRRSRALHTKLYYFESGDEYTAVIGSANITKGGVSGNEELSVTIRGMRGDPLFLDLQQYLAALAAMKFA